jgi:hypothetical protein
MSLVSRWAMTENFISVGRTSQGRPRRAREKEAMVCNDEERVMCDDEELGWRRRARGMAS